MSTTQERIARRAERTVSELDQAYDLMSKLMGAIESVRDGLNRRSTRTIEELDKQSIIMKSLLRTQRDSVCDEYSRGMYNGMERMLAIIGGREPRYLEASAQNGQDVEAQCHTTGEAGTADTMARTDSPLHRVDLRPLEIAGRTTCPRCETSFTTVVQVSNR